MLPDAIEIEISMPTEIFGSVAAKMPKAIGVYANVFDLIGKLFSLNCTT